MQSSPSTGTYPEATQTRVENTDTRGNLERALSRPDEDITDLSHESMIQRFFAQQSEWDVLFLDAYADLTDYGDNDTAQVLTRIFVEVLESCISEKGFVLQGDMTITTGLRRMLRNFDEDGSLNTYKIDKPSSAIARRWNVLLGTLETQLAPGWSKLMRRVKRTTVEMSTGNWVSSQETLFTPAGETIQ